ncbi:MAG: hypothetical protein ACREPB_04710 [Arenimonas sp.]
MNILYQRFSSICLLILACSFGASCSTERATQTEATVIEKTELETPVALENTVVASEDEVLTWDESAEESKSPPKKTDSKK